MPPVERQLRQELPPAARPPSAAVRRPPSPRLVALAALVPEGARVADIGADHALLACRLVSDGVAPRAVAIDLRPGAVDLARRNALVLGVADRVSVRQGDGLAPLRASEVDVIVMAGMGGATIAGILERGEERLAGVEHLVLGPQGGEGALRRWLAGKGWALAHEALVEDGDHTYVLVVAVPGDGDARYRELRAGRSRAAAEALYDVGPLLVARGAPLLHRLWAPRLARWRAALTAVSHAPNRAENLARRVALEDRIRGVAALLEWVDAAEVSGGPDSVDSAGAGACGA